MIKDFIEKHWQSNRNLLGYGAFDLLENINSVYPLKYATYKSGQRVMTWRVPEEWIVKEAYIEDEQGNRYLDYKDNPLHLSAYSTPIDKWIDREELISHIWVNGVGIPWLFKYYERDWQFCSQVNSAIDAWIANNNKFHVVIDAEYKQGAMLVGELQLGNIGVSDLVIMSHYDHPFQANDGLSGVAVALEVYRRLKENPPDWFGGVRFLFVPETIGSIAYFSDHDYSKITGGIFLGACGNDGKINLQLSNLHRGVDSMAYSLFETKYGEEYNPDKSFVEQCNKANEAYSIVGRGDIPGNDEIVLNSLGIPCVALNRFPYPEYHTSADTPAIISEDKLAEMTDITEEITRVHCTNYIPKQKYEGIPFLSGYGLWIDWRDDLLMSKAMEQIFIRFDGKWDVFEIADLLQYDFKLDYWKVREVVEKFRTAGLIETLPSKKED